MHTIIRIAIALARLSRESNTITTCSLTTELFVDGLLKQRTPTNERYTTRTRALET